MDKFERRISGYVMSCSSFSYARAVYSRNALPGFVRPARPARCHAVPNQSQRDHRSNRCAAKTPGAGADAARNDSGFVRRACLADAFEIGETSSDSTRMRGL